jgi:outer membrane biosynthesis protein TonB
MNTTGNSQKNIKAAVITIGVHAILLLLFFFVTIAMAVPPPPTVEEGIEVNLGNSDIGFGDVQPLIPDEPAPDIQPTSAPPQQQIETPVEETEKEVSERDDADAPEVNKPEKKTTPVKVTPTNNQPVVKTNPAPKTVINPTPAPPKPKAVFKGGTGTGGNNSDTYNNSRNQGIAGGTGDQGKANGNPNSDRYDGNGGTGNSGGGRPRVIGNRKIVKYYSFEGDLEKATINAIVKVSADGKGTFAGFGPGSTTQGAAYRNAIINYLRNIQFDKATDESTVTVQFNFKVND